MKKASITEAKNQLSALIAGLKGGSPVLIVERERPVARLEPVTSRPESDGRLPRLIRDGIVRPPAVPTRSPFTDQPRPPNARASAVEALLKERRQETPR